jgi:hypothetical protein
MKTGKSGALARRIRLVPARLGASGPGSNISGAGRVFPLLDLGDPVDRPPNSALFA